MTFQAEATESAVSGLVAESANPPDQRWARRRAAQAPAIAHVPGKSANISCRICDQSATGAQLEADAPNAREEFVDKDYEAQFWLYLPYDRAQVKCEVVWFAGKRFGVRYISPLHFIQQDRDGARTARR